MWIIEGSSGDSFEKVYWSLSYRINKTTDVNLTIAPTKYIGYVT